MNKENLAFFDFEIEKHRFHCFKYPLYINNVNIDKIMISNRVCLGKNDFKYFIR